MKEFWCRRFYNEMITELKSIYGSEILKTFPNFSEFIEKLNDSPWLFGAILQSTSKVWNCKLRLGYTNRYMTAKITDVEIINGKNSDLKIDKPVFAIHLSDIIEEIS